MLTLDSVVDEEGNEIRPRAEGDAAERLFWAIRRGDLDEAHSVIEKEWDVSMRRVAKGAS